MKGACRGGRGGGEGGRDHRAPRNRLISPQMQPASGPRRGESTQVECELPSSVGHTSLNANAGVAQRRRCMSRSDMWSNGFSFFLEVLDIKREFEDEDYSCRRSRHLHKSASVFIILTRLWCFCRFNLSAFGKTLSELVFLTRERIETRYVLLFFWGVLCQSSLWKETKVRCGEWRNI